MNSDETTPYLTSVMTLYLGMPETPLRVSLSDQSLARHFQQEGIPLKTIETALLLGSLRRLIRPADAPPLSPIRSLAYFRPVIDELLLHPIPDSYGQYLRLKLQQVENNSRPMVQKTAFSDDR